MNNLDVLPLWPDGPPDGLLQHSETEILVDHTGADQRLNRVYGLVSQPTFSIHKPFPENNTGAAVVVFPGGGYMDVWIDKEGYDAARWLNTLGITAVVVKYRTGPRDRPIFGDEALMGTVMEATLADAKRVMRTIRHHAAEWQIDPQRIGTMGFSAGGHLLLRLAAEADSGDAAAPDPIEQEDCMPSFSIPIYPAIPREVPNNYAKWGPVFMAVASDDVLTPAHVTAQATAVLLQENVDVELHVFRQGTHGFGMGIAGGPVRHWLNLCEEWLRDLNYI